MFRRAFVEEQRLDFQCVRNGNDVFFTACALCLADRITVVRDSLVYYRKNQSGSLVGTIERSPLSAFRAWADVRKHLSGLDAYPQRSYVNKVIRTTDYLLGGISKSYDAFEKAFRYLKEEGIEELDIRDREPEFYYTDGYDAFVSHLLHDGFREFSAYFMYLNYTRLQESNAEKAYWRRKRGSQVRALRKKNDRLTEKAEKDKARIERLTRAVTGTREKNTELRNRNAALKNRNAALKARNEELSIKTAGQSVKNTQLKEQLRAERMKNKELRNSFSYRLGRAMTWLPRKIGSLFKTDRKRQ